MTNKHNDKDDRNKHQRSIVIDKLYEYTDIADINHIKLEQYRRNKRRDDIYDDTKIR
nr:MAG TPA: hypothetical protein [Caudoviricetes sp.]